MTSANSNDHFAGNGGDIKAGVGSYQDAPIVMATALPPESTFQTVIIDDNEDDFHSDFNVAHETTPLVAVSYSQNGSRRDDETRNNVESSMGPADGINIQEEDEEEKADSYSGPIFRDWFFAVVFYAQLIAVLYAGIVYSPQGYESIDEMMNYTFIREQIELQTADDMTPEDWEKFDSFVAEVNDYIGVYPIRILLWTLIPGAFCAFFLTHVMIFCVIPYFSTAVVKVSLLLPVPLLLGWMGVWIIAAPSVGSLLVAGVLGALVVYYVHLVWPKIPFAAVNLKVATIGINSNIGTHVWAFFSGKVSVIWMVYWVYATIGLMSYLDQECSASHQETVDHVSGYHHGVRLLKAGSSRMQEKDDFESDQDCGQGGVFLLLLLSGYWTSQVLMNSVQVIVAGVMATWCFDKQTADGCCSPAVASSLYRSATYSFGSICLGSLFQGIMQLLRKIIVDPRSRRGHSDDTSCCGLCFCVCECCGRVLEDVLDYFHQWNYVFIGIYGYGYVESGKRVLELFVSKGWTSIISERLVNYVTGCITLTMGILTGLSMWAVTILVDWVHADEEMGSSLLEFIFGNNSSSSTPISYVYGEVPRHISVLFGFVIGAVNTSIMMSVVRGGVNTLIVCFADSPARLEEEHPNLAKEIVEAWAEAFPETIQRNAFEELPPPPPPMAEAITSTTAAAAAAVHYHQTTDHVADRVRHTSHPA